MQLSGFRKHCWNAAAARARRPLLDQCLARPAEDRRRNDQSLSVSCLFQLWVQKEQQPAAAMKPLAACVHLFWIQLMWNERAEDADPCQKGATPETNVGAVLLRSAAGSLYWPGQVQAPELKGYTKSKVARCNQPCVFLESQLSQAHRWKELSFSLQGLLAWIKKKKKKVQPYHSSQRTLASYYSVTVYSSTETWHVSSVSRSHIGVILFHGAQYLQKHPRKKVLNKCQWFRWHRIHRTEEIFVNFVRENVVFLSFTGQCWCAVTHQGPLIRTDCAAIVWWKLSVAQSKQTGVHVSKKWCFLGMILFFSPREKQNLAAIEKGCLYW